MAVFICQGPRPARMGDSLPLSGLSVRHASAPDAGGRLITESARTHRACGCRSVPAAAVGRERIRRIRYDSSAADFGYAAAAPFRTRWSSTPTSNGPLLPEDQPSGAPARRFSTGTVGPRSHAARSTRKTRAGRRARSRPMIVTGGRVTTGRARGLGEPVAKVARPRMGSGEVGLRRRPRRDPDARVTTACPRVAARSAPALPTAWPAPACPGAVEDPTAARRRTSRRCGSYRPGPRPRPSPHADAPRARAPTAPLAHAPRAP